MQATAVEVVKSVKTTEDLVLSKLLTPRFRHDDFLSPTNTLDTQAHFILHRFPLLCCLSLTKVHACVLSYRLGKEQGFKIQEVNVVRVKKTHCFQMTRL